MTTRPEKMSSRRSSTTRGKRPSASSYVLDNLSESIRDNFFSRQLLNIADEFDRKAFLPTFGDIENFCTSFGIEIPKSSSRVASIPRIFKFLSYRSIQELERILESRSFSGPTRLGPIADAIRGDSRRREPSSAGSVGEVDSHLAAEPPWKKFDSVAQEPEDNLAVPLSKCAKCGRKSDLQISSSPLYLFSEDAGSLKILQDFPFVSITCNLCGFTEFYSKDALEAGRANRRRLR